MRIVRPCLFGCLLLGTFLVVSGCRNLGPTGPAGVTTGRYYAPQQHQTAEPQAGRTSRFGSWFRRPEEPRPAESIEEFLSLDRPET